MVKKRTNTNQQKKEKYTDYKEDDYTQDDLDELQSLMNANTLLHPPITKLFSVYRNKVDDYIKQSKTIVIDADEETEYIYVEQVHQVLDFLPHLDPQLVLQVLKKTKGDTVRAVDVLLGETVALDSVEPVEPVHSKYTPPLDPVIDISIILQTKEFQKLSNTKRDLEELESLELQYQRTRLLKEKVESEMRQEDMETANEEQNEEEKSIIDKIKREKMWIEKSQLELQRAKNVSFYCDGELDALNQYKLNKRNNIKRYTLKQRRVFDCDAEDIHFRIAQSQFIRSNTPVNIEHVEYIVNPETVARFYKKKEELAQRHGFLLESMKPLLLFHGTTEENMESIIKTNFLISKVGSKTDMGWYGKGIYFSEHASLSIGYSSGNPHLLICMVLIGKAFRMENIQTGCAIKEGYDSHVAPDGCSEVVIFDTDQIIPIYKVKFNQGHQYPNYAY